MSGKIEPFTRSIARALRAVRRDRKLSQARVAHLMREQGVEIHQATISRIEREQLDISMGDLAAFCRVYGIDVLDVMTGSLTPETTREQVTR